MVRTRSNEAPDQGRAALPVVRGQGRGQRRALARGRERGRPRVIPVMPPVDPVEDLIIEEQGELPTAEPAQMDFTSAPGFQEVFAKFRADLSQFETKIQKVSEERNALKLLCGQKDETIKDLQADLDKAREEEAELDKQVTILLMEYGLDPTVEANTLLSQLQQRVERIKLLQGEVDQVKADCDRWKENMDRLAAKKETTLARLSSAEVQLRGIKEKSLAQAKRIEDLETGLVEAKAEIEKTKRETHEEIHAQGFDLSEEIAQAKVLEAEARQLASFDDEDDDEEGSRGGSDEGPEGEVAPGEEVETGRS
ncbi:uncharacterized protein [Nicotiana tomentosiformis]|uniref:uncharacterized protein n=1 Tax=Nicotiana tomentosiformis TaxID=4098 RepID=UPI00388CD299